MLFRSIPRILIGAIAKDSESDTDPAHLHLRKLAESMHESLIGLDSVLVLDAERRVVAAAPENHVPPGTDF